MKDLPKYTLKAVVNNWIDEQKRRLAIESRLKKAAKRESYMTEYDVKINQDLIDDMRAREKDALKRVERMCKEHPMWPWLESVKGVGPSIAGAMLSQFDIHKADTVSKFWAYAGLDVVDGSAPRLKKGETSTFNGWLRMILVGRLGPSFIKVKAESPYKKIYYDTRHRLECKGHCGKTVEEHVKDTKPKKDGKPGAQWFPSLSTTGPQPGDFCTAGHMHNKAIREMVKRFLADFHTEWRTVEGLPVRPPYSEEKLGMPKHGGEEAA